MPEGYEWSESEGFAELYQRFFVPALFADWGVETVNAGRIESGERALDVACGTGVVARRAAGHGSQASMIVGLDLNRDMLRTAARLDPSIRWDQGDAADLPFRDHAFDVVFSQFALMFMADKEAVLREMRRVGGRMVVAVWESIDQSPGYREFVDMLESEHSREAADMLRSPFVLGNKDDLAELFRKAGLKPEIITCRTQARFPSLRAWIETDVRATPMSELIDEEALERLIAKAPSYLGRYRREDGHIQFDAPAHLVLCPSQ